MTTEPKPAATLTYDDALQIGAARQVLDALAAAHCRLACALIREAMAGADTFRADVNLPAGIVEADTESRAIVKALNVKGAASRKAFDAHWLNFTKAKSPWSDGGAFVAPFLALRDAVAAAIEAEPELPTVAEVRAALTADRPN